MPDSKNTMNGAEAMVRLLEGHDVTHIFGLCGDTSLPFYDALYRLKPNIDHILTRDERSASYMADAYARVTGKVGVCEGPSGGGATYIAPGLVEANESSVPVLAITTDVSTTAAGHYPLTELDQAALFAPLTKWNGLIGAGVNLPSMVRTAFRAMTTGRPGSAHLALPYDVQTAEIDADDVWADAAHGRYPARRAGPDPEAIAEMAAALVSAKTPVIICGGGVVISGAMTQLHTLGILLDIPIATTISGQGSIAETDGLSVGVVGSNGGINATRAVIEAADLVLFIGCRAGSVTTERWRFPGPGTRTLHIDIDPMVIGATYRTEVGIAADAQLTLAAINAALATGAPRKGGSGKARAATARKAKAAQFAALAASNASPIRPERVVAAVERLADPDAIIVADPGTPCPYFSAYYTVRQTGRSFFSNRAHGALGYSLSAAIGAHYGRPDVKTIAVMGDGSFGFTSGELETAMRKALPITFIVLSNAAFGWIKAGQKTGFGERYFSVDFSPSNHAAIAAAYGLKTWRIEDPNKLDAALKAAFAFPGPSLVDIVVQPLQDTAAPVSEWVA